MLSFRNQSGFFTERGGQREAGQFRDVPLSDAFRIRGAGGAMSRRLRSDSPDDAEPDALRHWAGAEGENHYRPGLLG